MTIPVSNILSKAIFGHINSEIHPIAQINAIIDKNISAIIITLNITFKIFFIQYNIWVIKRSTTN